MKNLLTLKKNMTMNRYSKQWIFRGCFLVLILLQSCVNDLNESVYDQIPQTEFGKNSEQLAALIGPLYAGLGQYYQVNKDLNTVSDDQVVVVRDGGWKDNDKWLRYKNHTYSPVLDDVTLNDLWKWIYENVTAINTQLANPNITDIHTIAELKTLRAFYHYQALDNFGNAIIADKISSESPKQSKRAQLYAFVESELLAAIPDLLEKDASNYGRMNKYVGLMVLAKLYLNAEVYTGTPQWQKAIDACTQIITSNKYSIAGDFFSTFKTNNESAPEAILSIPFDASKRGGFDLHTLTLNNLSAATYSLNTGAWNGFATQTDFYNTFDDVDIRKKMWLVGQQYKANGDSIFDGDTPFAYTPEIPSFNLTGKVANAAGARPVKYEIALGSTGNLDNDFVIYRLSDVYMMRGEAYFRLGNTTSALEDINFISTKRGLDAYTTLTLDIILAERGRELAWEYHRRQDLIRFGQFNKAWQFKEVSPAYTEIYPIPASQLALNPNLIQNSGY